MTREEAVKKLNLHADSCRECDFSRKCNTTLGCCEEGKKILASVASSNGKTPAL